MMKFLTAALYKFVSLPDFEDLQAPLQKVCDEHDIRGMLLLAKEGINGTIAGAPDDVYAVLDFIKSDPRMADLVHKESFATKAPFYRMKVKLKKEIVTMGVDFIDPNTMAGKYVKPKDWNALITDPDVVVVDTRNDYEVRVGTFKGAINPETQSFRELPEWVENADILREKKKVAMFCTGGIRCEKSTAYLKSQGFDEVYHLEGGILKYLEEIPEEESLWEGDCFVFDERVTVKHGLEPGEYELCRACRNPVSPEDKTSEHWEEGVSCPWCINEKTDEERERFRERQRQIRLARQRGECHVGKRYVPRKRQKA
ncbi:rhodanese-related sulfurtransferase [Microvenator marinus]|jgi:UPF0176 protein|uniref:tRNA uridine(34) hydroxylase n=1 Tax=Microvenator marinus TaxID=2600177 RepID=A0A5B8XWE9_9DELT|nr:rhodanese-related sulfurtransferase [Microvenator marinus]QED29268.1 rhodanese-related sulfurtransferase [Microvenator marinus]